MGGIRFEKLTDVTKGAQLKELLGSVLACEISDDIRDWLRDSYDIEVSEGVTFVEAIIVKLAIQALTPGKAGDKALDAIMAAQPKESKVTMVGEPTLVNSDELEDEDLRVLRRIRDKAARALDS